MPNALTSPSASTGLLELLEKETLLNDSILRDSGGGASASTKYGEEWSIYYSNVLGGLSRVGNKQDQRVLNALAMASYNADSEFAVELAKKYGEQVAPAIAQKAKSNITYSREAALEMLGTIIVQNPQISSQTRSTIRTTIITALTDAEGEVRRLAVRTLGAMGDPNDLPILQTLANSDTQTIPDSRGGARRFPVREEAQKAISKIRQK